MVKAIKYRAPKELGSLRKRVLRVQALGRVSPADADKVIKKIDDLEKTIDRIEEKEEN